jgi:hypothetical protein
MIFTSSIIWENMMIHQHNVGCISDSVMHQKVGNPKGYQKEVYDASLIHPTLANTAFYPLILFFLIKPLFPQTPTAQSPKPPLRKYVILIQLYNDYSKHCDNDLIALLPLQ